MDRGAGWATVLGVVQLDMTERLTLSLSLSQAPIFLLPFHKGHTGRCSCPRSAPSLTPRRRNKWCGQTASSGTKRCGSGLQSRDSADAQGGPMGPKRQVGPSLLCRTWLLRSSRFCPNPAQWCRGSWGRGRFHPQNEESAPPAFRGSWPGPSSYALPLTATTWTKSRPPGPEHQVPCWASQGTLENPQGWANIPQPGTPAGQLGWKKQAPGPGWEKQEVVSWPSQQPTLEGQGRTIWSGEGARAASMFRLHVGSELLNIIAVYMIFATAIISPRLRQ